MKINKKIIVAMCLVSILSVGCGCINEENKSNERVENIENHIPYIDKNNDEIDNSIINERYENVKKEDLTYDTEKDDSKDNEKEVITEVYSADSIKNENINAERDYHPDVITEGYTPLEKDGTRISLFISLR